MMVELDPNLRSTTKTDNLFDCTSSGLTDIDGVKTFKCSRPQCYDARPFCNLTIHRNFIIAYGEG